MNNLEKWLISIEPEKVIEEIQTTTTTGGDSLKRA